MAFTSHTFLKIRSLTSGLWVLCLLLGLALAAGFGTLLLRRGGERAANELTQEAEPEAFERSDSFGGPNPAIPSGHWLIFRDGQSVLDSDVAGFVNDYRFAGTFFLYGADDQSEVTLRRAVVAYLPDERQFVVSEGDEIVGARVVEIHEDHLVLRKDGALGTLYLRDRQMVEPALTRKAGGREKEVTGSGESTTRFGQRLREGYWELSRESLMDYYEELLDEPERLLHVFDSMAPLYSEDGRIEGYELNTVGEADFFAGVGFVEGDRVREVNSLAMTSRRRAEYFIRQVVENRLSAVVIDLERNGEKKRIVYQIR